jgi:hypothetical protein
MKMTSVTRGLKWFLGSILLALIACGGDPGSVAPPEASTSSAVVSGPFTLTLNFSGTGAGSVSGVYWVDAAPGVQIPIQPCSRTCQVVNGIPAGAHVTLTGAPASSFTGFQRPYCEVRSCDWSDPEFMPPTQYAWSADPYTFTMSSAKTVNARFTLVRPATFRLTLYVTGPAATVVSGTQVVGASSSAIPFACAGAPARTCTALVNAGALVTLTGPNPANVSVSFQRLYCEVYPDVCAAELAADPDWYPLTMTVWAPAPYAFTMTSDKGVTVLGGFVFEPYNYTEAALSIVTQIADPTISRDKCAQLCDARADCKVASWCDSTTPLGWANTCVLRSAANGQHQLQGVSSWVKP